MTLNLFHSHGGMGSTATKVKKKEYNKRLFVSLPRLDNFGLSCSTIVELPKKVYNIFYLAFACTCGISNKC